MIAIVAIGYKDIFRVKQTVEDTQKEEQEQIDETHIRHDKA